MSILTDQAMEYTVKSRYEIEALKLDWFNDPCWDIEDTEGFEAYREELKAYSVECEKQWDAEAEEREKEHAAKMGLTPDSPLFQYIRKLERRLERLEDRFDASEF